MTEKPSESSSPLRRLVRRFRPRRRHVRETREQLALLIDRMDEVDRRLQFAHAAGLDQHGQLVEILRVLHNRARWQRERLWELRCSAAYERAFSEPKPLVSVVIATYDNHQLLRERAIPSVLAQTYQHFEIVVVGDAAPDEARAAAESFDDERIKFWNRPYRGPYPDDPAVRWYVGGVPPFNEGVRMATGLWMASLDDDDAFRPHHIERLLTHARKERLELVFSRICEHAPDGTSKRTGRFPPALGELLLQASLCPRDLACIFELELSDWLFGRPSDQASHQRMMEAGVRIGMVDDLTVDLYPLETVDAEVAGVNERKYLSIAAHYEACLERYGDTHRGVDWPRAEDVDVRYRVMLEVMRPFPPDQPTRLLDFGCGASHLYEYIGREGLHHIQYAGLDISEPFVALSRRKFPHNEYWCADVLTAAEADLPRADYAAMNGVFTEKVGLSYGEMIEFFTSTVARVFDLVECGVAFNVMTKHLDWERDDLFHLSFDDLVSILTTHVSRHFVIRNDYGLYEYTVYAYRPGVTPHVR